MRTLLAVCCLFSVTGGTDPADDGYGNRTAQVDDSKRRYINIGDGASLEFDFPENTKGVIVISSRYRSAPRKGGESWRQTVNVKSLDTDV
ncbi:P3 protein, partial [Atractosteus spatula]|nr:P3 protein [Atractosteus spatula]